MSCCRSSPTTGPMAASFPEIAARAHLEHLDGLIARAMSDAGLTFDQLDGVAATGGPGLIGGVIVGVMTAKAIAAVRDLPFIAVNHLEGHALTARLTDPSPEGWRFPIFCCWCRAATASFWRWKASAGIAGWAPRSTTRSARRSTRRPS